MDSSHRLTFNFLEKNWLAESVILLTVVLTFGASIHQLGLYGSQWAQVLQPGQTISSYGIGGLFQALLIKMIGANAPVYHLINAILFSVLGIMIYRLLIGINETRSDALAISLLFLVFPGFIQSTAAYELSTVLSGLIFSLMSLMFFSQIIGNDGQHKGSSLISGFLCGLAAISISAITSIFEGLVVILFLIFRRKGLGKYVAGAEALFGIGSLIAPVVYQFNSIHFSLTVVVSSIRQWLEAYLTIWRTIVILPSGGSQIIFYFIALFVLFFILLFVFRRLGKDTRQSDHDLRRLLIGLLLTAGSGFVLIFSTSLLNSTSSLLQDDGMRMVLTGLAVSCFLVCVIKLFFLDQYHSVILALVILLAGGARFQMIDRFAQETRDVNDFLSQLQVRADGFKTGTSLLVEQLPFNNTTRDSLQALIRNRFAVSQKDSELQLIPADDSSVREFLMNSETGSLELRIDNKLTDIRKDYVLAVFSPKNGCIQILEPDEVRGEIPYGLRLASNYSNTSLINVNNLSDVLQLDKFRTTIEKDSCYETQLIHRYAAQKSWEDIVNTYEKMPVGSKLQEDLSIGKPVLQALINTGDIQEALNLTNEFKNFENYKESICPIWTEALADSSKPKEVNASLVSVKPETGCP